MPAKQSREPTQSEIAEISGWLRRIFDVAESRLPYSTESRSLEEQLQRIIDHGPNPPTYPLVYEYACKLKQQIDKRRLDS
jgi:hypothetical protein